MRNALGLTLIVCVPLLARSVLAQQSGRQIIIYSPTDENFLNPERGFYQQDAPFWIGEERSPQNADALRDLRVTGISMLRWYLVLDEFRDKPLSDEALAYLDEQFDIARRASMKVIPRVAYNFPIGAEYPYTDPDAPLEIVLLHIDQLKPLLRANSDVIAFMEMGFVGAWGEWHSSTNNLVGDNGLSSASRQIVQKLLNALPQNRMVAMRYAPYKQALFGPEPTTLEESLRRIDKARMGAHNDCFLASFTDWGTYPETPEGRAALREYLHQDNRFVPQGGETCNDGEDAAPYIGCQNALADLQLLRFSALNVDYHPGVLQRWRDEGCFEVIARRLGYRFELLRGDFPSKAEPGQSVEIRLTLRNTGFASPYNPRGLELVLRGFDTGSEYRLILDEIPDVRRWLPDEGEITLNLRGAIPSEVTADDYEILLRLPDPAPTLYGLLDYSIRLANSGLWEATTGYNRLNALIRVG
ncbi:MAG: DUF4832 domain-containing protein [Anaerolineae bacterium]|nr:DUF4832 domain-containing protein [Anaerolineae bacterium]MDW8173883.1 DUF4832 domain-containing protein [Anaerolineae bacterium]